MPKRYYSRSDSLCEKQAIREQELDHWSSKTATKGWGNYLERGHKTQNDVKQTHYKESTIENIK